MKCLCGYEEPESYTKETPVYFQSGKRKGELKTVHREWIEPREDEKFIRLGVEKGFAFINHSKSWGGYEYSTDLYACPKCGTVKMEIN